MTEEVLMMTDKNNEKCDSQPAKGHTYVQWTFAIIANTTLLTYGLQTGWVSPMTKVLQSDSSPTGSPLTDGEISWVAGVLCLAAAAGVPAYAYIADRFGRKATVFAIAIPQAICWLIKISSANTAIIIVARIFCGISAGGCFNSIPIYVKEISQDSIRGLTGSLLILCQNIGILGIYAMGAYLDYFTIVWICLVVPILTMICMIKAPESPAFLVKMGRIEEATKTTAYLRGLDASDKLVQFEINSMEQQDFAFKAMPNVSFASIFRDRAWRRSFLLISGILTIAATNGCFAIVMYASTLTAQAGATFSPELQTLSFPAVMILAAFVSMACVDRFGRKPLLAVTFALVALAMAVLATAILLRHQGTVTPAAVPVLSMVLAVSAFSAGPAPLPYIMMSEMFNFQIRAKASGMIVTYAWLVTSVPLLGFAPLSAAWGLHAAFYTFAAINLLGLAVTLVLLPETRGKTVEQIEEELRYNK